jgi:uncharacterized protein
MRNWLRAGLALLACAAGAQAVDWKTLQPQGYVSDFAGVIAEADRAPLEAYCHAVEQSTGAQMALVTVQSLEGEPIEDVANAVFRAWGVGQKGKNEGILLLLSVGDRRSRLEVGYGLEPILPDGLSGSILRQMRPALRQGDYGDAMLAAAETIGATIAQAKHVSLTTDGPPRRYRSSASDSIPWPMILGGVFLLFWLLRAFASRGGGRGGGGGFLSGLLLGNLLGGSSWGGSGSGGFGGSDSGDGGFGGFGGGDSGGGGASSDW